MNKKKNIKGISMVVFALIVILGLGTYTYAIYYETLKINGKADMNFAKWDIKFQNLSPVTTVGSPVVNTNPTLTSTTISGLYVTFNKPGDEIRYKFEINNAGDLDAKIITLVKDPITCTGSGASQASDESLVCGNLTYTLKYTSNGNDVAIGDTLNSKDNKQVEITLKYTGTTLPMQKVDITGLGISITYEQN